MTHELDVAQQALWNWSPEPDCLADRVILVTGANRGIGRAVAMAAAAHGSTVVLLGRDLPGLEAVADAIAEAAGPEALVAGVNLEGASVDDYARLAELIGQRCGRLDGLLLNAGMLGHMSRIEDYDPLLWARVFQVNVHSQFLLTQALIPLLRRAADPAVVFTSSGVGRRGRAHWGAYAVTKFATEGMMQTLADECEGAVRVAALNPGKVRTRMRGQAYPAEDPATLATPEQVAPAYLYLLGPEGADAHGLSLDAQRS